eukprot:Clim_evm9s21 gene=Clim_evmTU9s21
MMLLTKVVPRAVHFARHPAATRHCRKSVLSNCSRLLSISTPLLDKEDVKKMSDQAEEIHSRMSFAEMKLKMRDGYVSFTKALREHRRCHGCGAVFQDDNPSIAGYITLNESEEVEGVRELVGPTTVCSRCHDLRHYQSKVVKKQLITPMSQQVADPIRLLKVLKKEPKSVVFAVVDLADFPYSWPAELEEALADRDVPLVVIGNKVDLITPSRLPASRLKHLANLIKDYIKEQHGSKHPIRLDKVYFTSALKKLDIEHIVNYIDGHVPKGGSIHVVGKTNSGKSTLVSALVEYFRAREELRRQESGDYVEDLLGLRDLEEVMDEKTTLPTVSFWPGTTMERITYRLPIRKPNTNAEGEKYVADLSKTICDLPGFDSRPSLVDMVTDPKDVKAYTPSQSTLRPRVWELRHGDSIFVGSLCRIDFKADERGGWTDNHLNHAGSVGKANVTFHVPQNVMIKRVRTENAQRVYQRDIGTGNLGPPLSQESLRNLPALRSQDYTIDGETPFESQADIVLSGLGWFSVAAKRGKSVTCSVWTPGGYGTALRSRPLQPQAVRARDKMGSHGDTQRFRMKRWVLKESPQKGDEKKHWKRRRLNNPIKLREKQQQLLKRGWVEDDRVPKSARKSLQV